jgi:hypothetical protein
MTGGCGTWHRGPHETLSHEDEKWIVDTQKAVVTRKDVDRKKRYTRDGSAVDDFPAKQWNHEQQKWDDNKVCFDDPSHENTNLSAYQKRWLDQKKLLDNEPEFGFNRDGSQCNLRQSADERGWKSRCKTATDDDTNFAGKKLRYGDQVIESAISEEQFHNYTRTRSSGEARWASKAKTIPNAPRR